MAYNLEITILIRGGWVTFSAMFMLAWLTNKLVVRINQQKYSTGLATQITQYHIGIQAYY